MGQGQQTATSRLSPWIAATGRPHRMVLATLATRPRPPRGSAAVWNVLVNPRPGCVTIADISR